MKHIICFSQGHSSGLVAIEVVRKFGKENVILVNHAMNNKVEEQDIRRFGKELSNCLEIPITYVNYQNIIQIENIPTQFQICKDAGAFKNPNTSNALCTARLKTEPFNNYLKEYFSDKNCIIYYGFDAKETLRIERRASILGASGYKTDYPLALWKDRTIFSTNEIGIKPPNIYNKFKHANCTGCLKGGMWHWYVTYCERYDLFCDGKNTEDELGYTILRKSINGVQTPFPLEDFEPIFKLMKLNNVPATEHLPFGEQRKYLKQYSLEVEQNEKPCECFV